MLSFESGSGIAWEVNKSLGGVVTVETLNNDYTIWDFLEAD